MDRLERIPESETSDRYARLARKALSAYGLAEERLTPLGEAENVTFEVATGDPSRHYALRICAPDHDPHALRREILWLTAICRDTDLVVPEPILTMDGELVRRVSIAGVSGFRSCVLLRWVDGEFRHKELAPDHLHGVGRLTATLHSHAETFRWPEEITPPRRNATLISDVLDEALLRTRYSADQLNVFRRAIERISVAMSTLRDGPRVAGVIHGQLSPRCLLFHNGEARAIGFDRCRWGYYAYDLATIGSYVAGREAGEELVAALLEGYRSLRDLPEDVERLLPVFDALRSIDRIQAMLAAPAGSRARDLGSEYEALRRVVEAE
jgi:Ser/Thr protein kinase RdoA (MazF antagonist)